MVGYEANGYLGQFLVVYPDQGIVAVRMIRPFRAIQSGNGQLCSTFRDPVRALIP